MSWRWSWQGNASHDSSKPRRFFFGGLELCIIPVLAERGYEAIALLVLESIEQGGLVLGNDAVGGVASFTHEADLALEQR